ncbi:LuxR C-terminal-related transcriptional regulator [Kitasatospora sp. NPDC096140]|uniref:LuxR C-terminal-related transcriptional regulator n=1 Tax=Kitasatospora sp. NPDC096140 TaxID=3155425 RepID=UPI0033311CC8
MTTPPTADSPTPERHRDPARADHAPARLLRKLTPREAQTLAHLAAGHDLPRTAASLGVTPTTARSYLLRAMRKLGASSQAEAVTLAAGSLPYVPPPGPANFAGLTPSSLGPVSSNGRPTAYGAAAPTAAQASGRPDAVGAPDGLPVSGSSAGRDAGRDGNARVAPAGPTAAPPPANPRAAAPTVPDREEAPTGDGRGPATGARRGRSAQRARQERGDTAHTPARGRPATRPDRATPPNRPDTAPAADEGPRTGAVSGPAPSAAARRGRRGRTAPVVATTAPVVAKETAPAETAAHGRSGAADEDGPQPADVGRAQQAAREERDGTAGAPTPEHRRRPSADRTAPSGAVPDREEPTGTPRAATATPGRPPASSADGPDRAGSAHPARRGDVAAEVRAATTAEGPQRPSDGGRVQPGPDTPPSAAAGRDRARPEAGGTAAGSEQPPAGTDGHGGPAHTPPPASVADGSARPPERHRDPSPAVSPAVPPAAPLPADLPAPTFEELYESAHTRLVQQAFLLTACRHRAVHCVRRAFGEARRRWPAVAGSGDPEGWVRLRAFELALSPWHRGGPRRAHAWSLPHRRIKVRPADESQAVLPDHDRLTDRDRALLKALKRLSRPQRRALVLHDGLGLTAAAIAVEVESTQAAAEGRVWTARTALALWVPDLVGPDPAAPGFADGLSLLLHRAAVRGCPQPHRSPIPVLRARHRLWTASRTGAAALLTVAVGGATLATLAGVRPAVLFRPSDPPTPSLCLPVGEAQEPGVPVLPGGAPNGISSLWCSPAPGLEAVLVEPHTQAVARWELPAAARGADAPPPRGPAVCRMWSPLPCTTGPTGH